MTNTSTATGAEARADVGNRLRTHVLTSSFIVLATALLLLTLAWHIPMMLWDHLVLAPLYQAWQNGSLTGSELWHSHNEHMYAAPYAVLLLTTRLSGGHPWLDCLVSWCLLIGYATIVLAIARNTFCADGTRGLALSIFIVFLALYPGHLANLQWGWQVAVFLCLIGAVATIRCLTLESLTWGHLAIALLATLIAVLSFATAIALIPTAIVLIALREDHTRGQRVAFAAPWVLAGVLTAFHYLDSPAGGASTEPSVFALLHYALNYLGAGVARFATDLAPWLGLVGLVSGFLAFLQIRRRRDALPWLGLALFGLLGGILIALGRAGPFGSDQAFVTRYVSFSSVFWIGWVGLIGMASNSGLARLRWLRPGFVTLVGVLAIVNALQMTRKAARVADESRALAASVRAAYPQVDEALLQRIYFDESEVARRCLDALHQLGFPPFERDADAAGSAPP